MCDPSHNPTIICPCSSLSLLVRCPPSPHIQMRTKKASSRSQLLRAGERGVDLFDERTGAMKKYTGDYVISPGRIKSGRASELCMRSRTGRLCGDKKKGATPKALHDKMLAARVERKRQKAAAEEKGRREKEQKRKAVLKKLRRRAQKDPTRPAKAATLEEIADLLGSRSSRLEDIAALVGVGKAGVEKVGRASRKALGQTAASASKVSTQIGRNISAALGPVLAGLLNLFSFDDHPDPLGVLMLVLRNTKFTQHCFGGGDLLSELIGCKSGAEHLTLTQVRDSWQQLVRERDRDRARGTLALAVRSFKTRAQCSSD